MELDHDSGIMFGTVLEGPLKDRELGNMTEQEFLQLLNYCRQHDQQSARLLETYLDKRFGDNWRDDDTPGNDAPLSEVDEAYQILGLEKEQVKVNVTLLGGGFGRKSKPDFSVEAALLAKQTGKPVKVTWSREDEVQHGYYHDHTRPRCSCRFM